MEPHRTPSWGAPASGGLNANPLSPHTPSPQYHQGQGKQFSNRFQRPSPYNPNRSRNGTPDNGHSDDSPKTFQNFSSGNPFQNSCKKFSSDNPYQKSMNRSYQDGNSSSPSIKPFSHSSPLIPGGPHQRFSSNTPSKNFHGHSRNFQTPSPVRFMNDSNCHSNFAKRPFTPRNRSTGLRNPGSSDNIRDYVSPSMIEDPWKDLPATPIVPKLSK
uniref:M-phase-specific PLK1-interacting protein n=1 Tax=Biomphalaria glabrata TaxID=6526 RepID=A0A2C9LIC2_BIOGL